MAQIESLAQEPPYATDVAVKRRRKGKENDKEKSLLAENLFSFFFFLLPLRHMEVPRIKCKKSELQPIPRLQ